MMRKFIGNRKAEICGQMQEIKNSKFFHSQTKLRKARSRIIGLHDSSGLWVSTENEINKVAVHHFEEFFTSNSPMDFQDALSEIYYQISDRINVELTALAMEDEVRKALFMHPEKVPFRWNDYIVFSFILAGDQNRCS